MTLIFRSIYPSLFLSSSKARRLRNLRSDNFTSLTSVLRLGSPSSLFFLHSSCRSRAAKAMEGEQITTQSKEDSPSMKLLFVEMGVGYDQHGYLCYLLNLIDESSIGFPDIDIFTYINKVKLLCTTKSRHYGCGNEGLQRCYLFEFYSCFSER